MGTSTYVPNICCKFSIMLSTRSQQLAFINYQTSLKEFHSVCKVTKLCNLFSFAKPRHKFQTSNLQSSSLFDTFWNINYFKSVGWKVKMTSSNLNWFLGNGEKEREKCETSAPHTFLAKSSTNNFFFFLTSHVKRERNVEGKTYCWKEIL